MTSAISPVAAPAPVARASPPSNDDSDGAQIAALQKLLHHLQHQLTQTAKKDRQRTVETVEVSEQISGVQSQIAMLEQQAARKLERAEEHKEIENRTRLPKPPPKSREQIEQEQEERDALATAKAVENGLTIGTNVDTYA